MSIMDDYKQLRMIESIKNLIEMEIAYKANLKLCKNIFSRMHLTREQVKDLLPILQRFVETGEIGVMNLQERQNDN